MHRSSFATIGVIAAGALLATVAVESARSIWAAGQLGMDFGFYREVGARFLADGSYYLAHQLAGPYGVSLMVDVLYPPLALLVFIPVAVLPIPLATAAWWGLPTLLSLYVIVVYRPSRWAVALMLLLLTWPRAIGAYLFGNTDVLAVAAVAGGLRWGWPVLLLAIKPTLLPFAIIGIRHRSFWIATAALAALSLLMLPMWLDYLVVLRNLSIGGAYSLGSVPLLLVPVVARFGSQTTAAAPDGPAAVGPSS
jgi:hypothetical protein